MRQLNPEIYPSNLMSVRRPKNSNLLIEFLNLIFIKSYFKAYWHWTCIQIKFPCKVSSIVSYLFVLQIVKDQHFLGVLPNEAPPKLQHEIVAELTVPQEPPTAFNNIWKFNLHSKTDISKTAWINAWNPIHNKGP